MPFLPTEEGIDIGWGQRRAWGSEVSAMVVLLILQCFVVWKDASHQFSANIRYPQVEDHNISPTLILLPSWTVHPAIHVAGPASTIAYHRFIGEKAK